MEYDENLTLQLFHDSPDHPITEWVRKLTNPNPETNPPPTPNPPENPPAPPAPPPQPTPLPPQNPPSPNANIGDVLSQLGQTLSALPERVADAVREQTPTPPPPPTPDGANGGAGNGAGATKKAGGRVANWWFGN